MTLVINQPMRPFEGTSGGGNTGTRWQWFSSNSVGKLNHRSTASLLLTSFTISSPSDFLRWTPPNASASFLVPTSPVGRLSRLIGLSDSRRYVLLRLFDLAYSLRIRLPLLVSAGFLICHLFSIYTPRIEINVEIVDEEDDDEDDVEVEIELNIEDEEDTEDDVRSTLSISPILPPAAANRAGEDSTDYNI